MKTATVTKFKETEVGPIPEEWDVLPIYNLAKWINGLAFRNIHFSDTGKPVVKINELKYGITDQTQFTEDIFDDVYLLKAGDLLFSWSGSPDTSIDAFWYGLPDGWLNQHIFKVVPNKEVRSDFLFYVIKSNRQKFIEIARDKQTTGLGHVTIADLKRFFVAFPEINEQKRIAEILSSLDDKIELNRKINASLENLASALFKKWFVDIGDELPRGWRIGKLGDVINIVYGKGLPTDRLLKTGYTVFGGNGVIGFYDKFLYDEPQIIIGCRGAGSGNIKQTYPKSFITNNSLVLEIPKDSNLNRFYLKYFLRTVDITEFVTGSAQPQITIENLKHLKVLIPSSEALRKFSDMILEFDKLSLNNELENKNLEIARDSLLPRLMSGKIRVK